MTCWLAQHGVTRRDMPPCEGRLVRVHLIPRRLFLRELDVVRATAAISDPRSWVQGCGGIGFGNGGHHWMLDVSRKLKIPRDAIPDGTEELAAETALDWWLDREYGRVCP